jgi:hypothetical protein
VTAALSDDRTGQYVRVVETTGVPYEKLAQLRFLAIQTYCDKLKQTFGSAGGHDEFAARLLNAESRLWEESRTLMSELRSRAQRGGVLFEYEWTNGATNELGFLVIEKNRIVRREAWAIEVNGE